MPPLLKIHHNVIHHLANFEESRRLAAKEKDELFPQELGALNTPPPSPEGEALVIQYVPGSVHSVAEAMDSIIQKWTMEGHAFVQRHNDIGGASVYRSNGRWLRLRESSTLTSSISPSTSEKCSLPDTAFLEHEEIFGRVVDLSGWTDSRDVTEEAKSSGVSSSLCLMSLVEAFAADPNVLSVSIEGRPVLLNYDARGVAQSGTSASTPFTDAGILGTGQVVGVADSGLDDASCFFWDTSNQYSSPYTTRSYANSVYLENSRRKVVMYVAYGDQYDQAVGHGTHVTGTIVGNSVFGGFSSANGVAPGAKVAFYDVMAGSSPYLSIPDLNTYVFKSMRQAGAFVLSNSWGSFSGECKRMESCLISAL